MAPRANWKGFLRLSLVNCPVALYPATSESEKVSFNQLNRKTGHRIKYAKVDAVRSRASIQWRSRHLPTSSKVSPNSSTACTMPEGYTPLSVISVLSNLRSNTPGRRSIQ